MSAQHIELTVESGHPVLVIDDAEIFDWVEDHLFEVHGLEYQYFARQKTGGRETWAMHFPPSVPPEVLAAAIAELSREEIERIWALNHGTS